MFRMAEDRARFIDSMSKIATVIALIGAGAWTILTYFKGREQEQKTALIEARKPLEAKRLELYIQISSDAAIIARGSDPKAVSKAKDDFVSLLLGPLALVQDETVRGAVMNFADCMNRECDESRDLLALKLSAACRESIAKGWGVYLPADAITKQKMEQMRN